MIKYFCKECQKEYSPDDLQGRDSNCPYCGKRAEMHSELFWCPTCNVPIYDCVCPNCGTHGNTFTSDARPVFPEERLLLGVLLKKPLAYMTESVWNGTGNRYYVNGKRLPFSLTSIKKVDPEAVKAEMDKYDPKDYYGVFNEEMSRWVLANEGRYHHINDEAREYIQHKTARYENDDTCAMFVSFSGGKDSTVVSDLVRKALSKPDIIHIFGNTTLEFPETYKYIERFKKDNRKTYRETSGLPLRIRGRIRRGKEGMGQGSGQAFLLGVL